MNTFSEIMNCAQQMDREHEFVMVSDKHLLTCQNKWCWVNSRGGKKGVPVFNSMHYHTCDLQVITLTWTAWRNNSYIALFSF